MNRKIQIDEAGLKRLIPLFYQRVRADALLGPVFNDAVDDWPEHIERLIAFWHSVMLGSGRYKGNPMQVHMRHKARITPDQFTRWLALWAATTEELMPPAAAAALQIRAGRIAESLQLGLFFRIDPPHPPGTAA